ncbi:MAG: hypothetical protein DWQ29_16605 [Planctomycetota bacterium]|nr:MAG: hypothetical protein DWQ29_16605 [Planctomycetota bacterium]
MSCIDRPVCDVTPGVNVMSSGNLTAYDRSSDSNPVPARPQRLTVELFEQPDSIALRNNRAGGPWVFLLLWLIGWTVGCVFLVVQVITEPELGMIAFAVPFWASWLFVAGLLVWMIFGQETLVLKPDEALFLRTAWVKLSSRRIPRDEIQGFRECRSQHTENDEHLWGIEMVTLGKPVRFAFRLPDRERAWLVHALNGFLESTGPDIDPGLRLSASGAHRSLLSSTSAGNEVIDLDDTLPGPPSETAWQLTEEVDGFTFSEQGRLHPGALGTLLFINAFWNGIVLVFVLALFGFMPMDEGPEGWEWWGMFVFLIPFEAIGLAMFAGLIAVMLEPFRHTKWCFEQDRIVQRTFWPLYTHTKSWNVAELDRLELRRSKSDSNSSLGDKSPFGLAFVAQANTDLCEIPNLTEGEARWLAGVVLELRPDWFGE